MVAQENFDINLQSLKRIKLSYVFLMLFLIFGFYLRAYHLNFPSIGYHNMKENEYISETIFFNEQGDFLHRRTFNFYGLEDGPGYFEEYAQPPLIPYMTLPFWKIFGEQLWIPRLIMIIFMLGSILLTYAVVKKLSKSEYLALLSSFLLTIMPLGIYFGRNIQPESPGLFFLLLTVYFYLKWIDHLDKRYLLYTALATAGTALFKLTFLIVGIPMLFLFPFKEAKEMFNKNRKEFYQQLKQFFTGLLPFIILQTIFEFAIVDPSKKNVEISIKTFADLINPVYWSNIMPSLKSYIADNYTWWFFWFAVIGVGFALLKYRSKLSKFIIGYTLAIPIYIGLLSGKIGGHSYYQMPFLPLFVIAGAYAIFTVGTILKQIIKIKHIEFVPLLILLLTVSSVEAANDRVWNTVFFGQDYFGQYIQDHTSPDERFFNFGHSQTQAVCTYAKRRCGDAATLPEFLALEKKFNIRFVHADAYHFSILQQNPELYNYLKNNYHVKLLGLIPAGNQFSATDILLEKGGTINLDEIQRQKPSLAKTYDMKGGSVPLYVVEGS